MRLTTNEIEYVSRKLVKTLVADGSIEVDNTERVVAGIARAMTEELAVEDRLNEEVRAALSEHTGTMERSDITYTDMFKALKRKMAKEKGVIL
jgi:hypothetical protein